ncbi:MAG TPA: alpha/beta hydrolase [Actinomycetota bacterium]|nr:alpha/beta hydrolase [Actinomycetota bacterium]HNO15950.1 alpha/beta hydrolase [Actinomycetota bacterium]HUM87810.1 alpha/beta hydrolase [Actinomycetota bacterium]
MALTVTPYEAINTPGPWTHRLVPANGAQFHLVEAGDGPLVLMLHGFPQYWWTWREYLPALADAGYRAAAMDLRGYAGSDHSPRGYDPTTLSNDVLGVIACLGEQSAFLVGHGWGAHIGWTAARRSRIVRGLTAMSAPHPVRLREAARSQPQIKAWRYALRYQWPWLPERDFAADDAQRVADVLQAWSVRRAWLTREVSDRFRAAFLEANTAHCAMEYHRWAWRSYVRADGRRFNTLMGAEPIRQPVLHIHGRQDPTVLPATTTGSGDFVTGPYQLEALDDCGHFPHEERPDVVLPTLLEWLDTHR